MYPNSLLSRCLTHGTASAPPTLTFEFYWKNSIVIRYNSFK
eukprot:UN15960